MCRVLCLALLGGVLLAVSGSAQLSKESLFANRAVTRGITQDRTVTESFTEHMHRLNAVVDQDAAALVEDLDLFWQRDRVSRLTRWHVP